MPIESLLGAIDPTSNQGGQFNQGQCSGVNTNPGFPTLLPWGPDGTSVDTTGQEPGDYTFNYSGGDPNTCGDCQEFIVTINDTPVSMVTSCILSTMVLPIPSKVHTSNSGYLLYLWTRKINNLNKV